MNKLTVKGYSFPILIVLFAVIISSCTDMEIPLPGQDTALFKEEFVMGRTGTWSLESDEMGSSSIVPEHMVIELNMPNTVQYSTLIEPTFSDFTLEVDGQLTSGSPSSTYGVLFRMLSPNEFYRFEITGDGMYVLERHDSDGSWVRHTEDWQDSEVINQGMGATNRIKVTADGDNISIFVNDVLLQEINDPSYRSGNIALDVGTFDGGGARVSFDNLIVYPPEG